MVSLSSLFSHLDTSDLSLSELAVIFRRLRGGTFVAVAAAAEIQARRPKLEMCILKITVTGS